MDLVEAIDTLYGADPAGFVATRTALARQARAAGHRDVAAAITSLRKPSVAAWILNALARTDPDVVARVRDLGTRLRTAQSQLDAAALTALRPERDALLDDVVEAAARAAATLGAADPTPAVRGEIRATFVAALADGAATDAVAGGHLTRALSYAGFGEVDLDDAVVHLPARPARRAAPLSPARPQPADTLHKVQGPEADDEAAEQRRRALAAARDELDRRERALVDARLAAAEADASARGAAGRVGELEALLERARHDAEAEARRATVAQAEADEAERRVTAARADLEDVG